MPGTAAWTPSRRALPRGAGRGSTETWQSIVRLGFVRRSMEWRRGEGQKCVLDIDGDDLGAAHVQPVPLRVQPQKGVLGRPASRQQPVESVRVVLQRPRRYARELRGKLCLYALEPPGIELRRGQGGGGDVEAAFPGEAWCVGRPLRSKARRTGRSSSEGSARESDLNRRRGHGGPLRDDVDIVEVRVVLQLQTGNAVASLHLPRLRLRRRPLGDGGKGAAAAGERRGGHEVLVAREAVVGVELPRLHPEGALRVRAGDAAADAATAEAARWGLRLRHRVERLCVIGVRIFETRDAVHRLHLELFGAVDGEGAQGLRGLASPTRRRGSASAGASVAADLVRHVLWDALARLQLPRRQRALGQTCSGRHAAEVQAGVHRRRLRRLRRRG
mmetsp:Transcript_24464/g.70782  ORF Transcript_24464/g.70782 Transcript_24464/m.70782 type:complete len:388 (-) Transcript_24464:285-1448(-)